MKLIEQIEKEGLPSHIAVIMDGNGRWAQKKGNPRVFGHKNGVKAVREITEGAAQLGIKYLTLYAFSKENWKRPKAEVTGLMSLLISTINSEIKTLMDNSIRLNVIGDIDSLPKGVRKELDIAMNKTAPNKRMQLNLALSYGARWEITEAVRQIAINAMEGKIDVDTFHEEDIDSYLQTSGMTDPELMIRTGGEKRISNFLLWQLSYAELYFSDVLWPDFRREDLYEAILYYQGRERRFGKISAQVKK